MVDRHYTRSHKCTVRVCQPNHEATEHALVEDNSKKRRTWMRQQSTPAAADPGWLALTPHSPALPLAKHARLRPLAPRPADKQS